METLEFVIANDIKVFRLREEPRVVKEFDVYSGSRIVTKINKFKMTCKCDLLITFSFKKELLSLTELSVLNEIGKVEIPSLLKGKDLIFNNDQTFIDGIIASLFNNAFGVKRDKIKHAFSPITLRDCSKWEKI